MRTSEVVHILDALEHAGVRYWLTGEWGVDALHGEATREHRDLDLAVDADTFETARTTLEATGFTAETDWLPVRLEMVGGPGGWADLHPVRFDSAGNGVQQGLDDVTFPYPAADLVVGSIAARRVPLHLAPVAGRVSCWVRPEAPGSSRPQHPRRPRGALEPMATTGQFS
ncbi:nucleotidyltransferase domain-containing protein [Lapillicoccus sp.]|uniref:nucleotidyltransferase domain-containing protein n=1 Tax=Lapillicoccus sp. TaxID=1909287 RepID=UPI00387EB1D2